MKRTSVKCSYCERTFARTEHLTRHERSHRNEKPFSCDYCDSAFSRKDVMKRHHLRYHPGLRDAAVGRRTPAGPTVDRNEAEPSTASPPSVEDNQADYGDYQHSAYSLQELDSLEIMDGFLNSNGDLGPVSTDPLLVDSDDLLATQPSVSPDDEVGTITTALPLYQYTQFNDDPPWTGTLTITPSKRNQLAQEVYYVLGDSLDAESFSFPSALTLERLTACCFESFLIFLPCIHIPTWRAEAAHPCLLLSMASFGATYNADHHLAEVLHRAARLLATKQLQLASGVICVTGQPIWLVQSMLIMMACGVSSGKYNKFQEASSWASLLGNIVRNTTMPEVDISDTRHDLVSTWERWIEGETTTRTKCATFAFLNNLTICYSIAPALQRCDMSDVFLPSNEAEWTSNTPESWMQIRQRSRPISLRFADAMKSIVWMADPDALQLSTFGAYIILHAVLQQIWRSQEDLWAPNGLSDQLPTLTLALQRWKLCWDNRALLTLGLHYSQGAISSNANAVLRLAYMRLHTNFSSVRLALASHNVEKVAESIEHLSIQVNRSEAGMMTALHAIHALRTHIKLGMAQRTPRAGPPQGLQVHLVSLECCLLSSAWTSQILNLPEVERTTAEREGIQLVEETVAEVELDAIHSHKPCPILLIYAWAKVYECCAIWGIQSVFAAALKLYGDNLSMKMFMAEEGGMPAMGLP